MTLVGMEVDAYVDGVVVVVKSCRGVGGSKKSTRVD
jgi:hypothetical protein